MLCVLCCVPAHALECVDASSISLVPPQSAGLAHSAASPLPTKSYDFAGTLIDAPEDYLFGRPTSDDTIYEWENPNVDRSKNVALVAPGFGTPTSYLPGSGEYLTPNLVPGALSGGLVNQVGSAGANTTGGVAGSSTIAGDYPSVDTSGNFTVTQIPNDYGNTTQASASSGYTVTANYTGEVSKAGCNIVTYTAVFGSEKDSGDRSGADTPDAASDPGAVKEPAELSGILRPLLIGGAALALVGGFAFAFKKFKERR